MPNQSPRIPRLQRVLTFAGYVILAITIIEPILGFFKIDLFQIPSSVAIFSFVLSLVTYLTLYIFVKTQGINWTLDPLVQPTRQHALSGKVHAFFLTVMSLLLVIFSLNKDTVCFGTFRVENGQLISEPLLSETHTLEINPKIRTTIFAGTLSGYIFRSRNNGLTWETVFNSTEALGKATRIHDVSIDPENTTTVYAATDDGVFRTENAGRSWEHVSAQLAIQEVHPVTVDSLNHNTIYAGTWGDGVYRSKDKGNTWERASNGINDLQIQSLAVSPVHQGLVYAATATGLYVSTNEGETWKKTSLVGKSVFHITLDKRNGDVVLINIPNDGIQVSYDRGDTWSSLSHQLPDLRIRTGPNRDFTSSDILYIGTMDAGVYASNNNGESWFALTGFEEPVGARIVQGLADEKVLIGSGEGLFLFDRVANLPTDCVFEELGLQKRFGYSFQLGHRSINEALGHPSFDEN